MTATAARAAAQASRQAAEAERNSRSSGVWRDLQVTATPWVANRLSRRAVGDAVLRTDALRRARLPAMIATSARLPVTETLLDYYRALDVDHFLLLGPTPPETAAPDVSWAQPRDSAGATALAAANTLAQRWLAGKWVLFALPHEFLVFPHMETRRLSDLVQHLEDDRRDVMHAALIDMYGPAAAADLAARRREHRWFDPRGYFQFVAADDSIEVRGGPLARLAFADAPHRAPQLQRIVLAKWAPHFSFRRYRQNGLPILLNRAHKPGEVSISGALLRYGALSPSGAPAPALAKEAGFEHDLGAIDTPAAACAWFDARFAARLDHSADLMRAGLICAGRWF